MDISKYVKEFLGVNMKSSSSTGRPKSPSGEAAGASGTVSEADRMIRVPEAAQILGLSEISVRRFLTKGTLRRYKASGRTLLRLSDVLGMIREA